MSRTVDEIYLTLPVPPITNQRLQINRKTKSFYRNPKNTNYQEIVKLLCLQEKLVPYQKDVAMRVWWYRKDKRGDVTDRWKDLCDALEGFAYVNDSQIADFHVARFPLNQGLPDQKESHILVHIKPLEKE